MKLLADESTDGTIVALLRSSGLEVLDVREIAPGIDDGAVLKIANDEAAVLVTEDKDFGELVFRLGMIHQGIILIRLSGWESIEKGRYVSEIVLQYREELKDAFSVISEDRVRVRKWK